MTNQPRNRRDNRWNRALERLALALLLASLVTVLPPLDVDDNGVPLPQEGPVTEAVHAQVLSEVQAFDVL